MSNNSDDKQADKQEDKSQFPYIHGFSQQEQTRLRKQARFGEQVIYQDIDLTSVAKLLEVGCGVGAQSEILLRRFPEIQITGIDLNQLQLDAAQTYLSQTPFFKNRMQIQNMDASKMSFVDKSFDGSFLCWILEHVPNPIAVLSEVRRVLKPGSPVYITEVMNSSFFLEPYSPNVWKYWMAFNDFQYDQAGDPFIGAKLGNYLLQTGFKDISIRTKTFHWDNREPQKRKDTVEYWEELLLSAAPTLVQEKYVSEEIVEGMKKEMQAVAQDPNAVFYYSFIQAKANA